MKLQKSRSLPEPKGVTGFARFSSASTYAVDDATHTVVVVKGGHRREVYRGAT